MSVYDDVKKALVDLLVPDIREIKGELKAVNIRLDSMNDRIDHLINMLKLEQRLDKLEREREQKESAAQ